MTNEQYFNFANNAVLCEQNEKYSQAALFWGKAADCALHYKNRIWAIYRKEHNEVRNTLCLRHEEECKKIANRKTAVVLKAHIDRSK
ncbi:ANR family transcriptional regulator [Xenorhabdus sp. 42]|uniref:ANR family transcriptional regulator n=1 Tax=Xenorhabdus szentirmaii TaxID=290112 RepID=UPI0019B2DE68|nr:ANR family transcriptional regulator [Xenorhabdus sp. 42]MBD2822653.1 ANR family transcriptional regulator [Xenorhabdus sp. 42]